MCVGCEKVFLSAHRHQIMKITGSEVEEWEILWPLFSQDFGIFVLHTFQIYDNQFLDTIPVAFWSMRELEQETMRLATQYSSLEM